MFIEEFGENFSEHMKKRLMELDVRTLLTRKDKSNVLDIKHVEHAKHKIADGLKEYEKEYVYGQLVVVEDVLYFSNDCIESDEIIKSHVVDEIYNSLSDEGMLCEEGKNLKIINDSNVDYTIDNILKACPQVSEKYVNIVKEMISRAENK
ncbi:hypothetical protein LQK79_03355 [Clostridium guangxiense]|nr:hypothetical protein [Clostridium guangxiense]